MLRACNVNYFTIARQKTDTALMASQPEFLQHCLQEAASASRLALERCIDDAVAGLQIAETQSMKVSERDEISGAWRFLVQNKAVWSARYPVDLLKAFGDQAIITAAARTAPPPATPSTHAPVVSGSSGQSRPAPLALRAATEQFSLVEDSDVTDAIESARLLQHILPAVDRPLAELDALISSVQGLSNVRPELNPLRPEIFTRVLRELIASVSASPDLYVMITRQLSEPLGRELKRVYERIVNMLELAHVQAASYRVLQTPAGVSSRPAAKTGAAAAPGAQPSAGGGQGSGPSGGHGNNGTGNATGEGVPSRSAPLQYADLSDYEIRDDLFQDFLFRGGSNAHQRLAPSYYEAVDQELRALQSAPDSAEAPLQALPAEARRDPDRRAYDNLPAVDRPAQAVDVLSQLNAQVWGTYARSRERAVVRTQLKKEATEVGQVLGLEVVRKLVSQVASDPRLLLPVREAIVALEPSLLRLAMVDPRFFSDESHPGRRLMERVAQRSFKYNDEFSPEFDSFFAPVTRAFNALNAQSIDDVQPFGEALTTLEYGWDEHDQQEVASRRKVLQALHFAEERQSQADQIAFDLSSRADLDNVPGVVLDFLFGPWALAMAHARLQDTRNQVDPEGFGSVVPDLLWSVKTDVTLKRPAKLIEMIPGLLEKLHSGLGMLGQTPQENEQFFESLMKLHQPVLRLRRLKTQKDAEESGAMPLEPHEMPATAEQRQARAAELPWLGREDLDAAGFQDTQPTAPGDLDELQGRQGVASDFAGLTDSGDRVGYKTVSQAADSAPPGAQRALHDAQDSVPADLSAPAASGEAPATVAYTREEAAQILLGLRTGSWVDLYSKHRWLRAQLIWASSKATLFMFLSHGGQPHSMTKRSCEKLIMQRLLRPVDTHGVVAQALDAVASEVAATAPPQPESVY